MSYIGRIAIIGDATVQVDSYNETSGMCKVTRQFGPAEKPPVPNPPFSSPVKELLFVQEQSFTEAFPFADKVQLSTFRGKKIPTGTIFDASDGGGVPANLLVQNTWWIKTSCRIIGNPYNKATFHDIGSGTFIQKVIKIRLNSSTDIVEFEDIVFTGDDQRLAVKCLKGSNITFRRCWFTDVKNAVYGLWDHHSEGWDTSVMSLAFEECVFHSCSEQCVNLDGVITAKFVNCTFQDSPGGVGIVGHVELVTSLCTFQGIGMAISGRDGDIRARVIDCTFHDIRHIALKMTNISSVRMKGCFVSSCASGLFVRGPRHAKVEIGNCVFQKCTLGISYMLGRIDSTIVSVGFHEVGTCVYVKWDVIGNVNLVDTSLHPPSESAFRFIAGEKCFITQNGTRVAPATKQSIQQLIDKESSFMPFDVQQLRRLKKAGCGDVTCFNCRKVEPPLVTYKMCGRCKKVCYCSRACQVSFIRAVHV